MSDSNLEDFYAELDARMAMPDCHKLSEGFRNRVANSTSGFVEPLPSNDYTAPHAEPLPTLPMYILFSQGIKGDPHSITRRQSKRKASMGSEHPLSAKKGKHQNSPPVSTEGRKTSNTSTIAGAPASIQDMSSVIEDFTDAMDESSVKKRDSRANPRAFLEDTSTITTPGNTPRTSARARSEASIVRPKSSVTATAKQSTARKKKNAKIRSAAAGAGHHNECPPPPPQPSDLSGRKARQLSAKLPVKAVQPPQYLKNCVIFYTGGDLTYASARTRGCMNYIHRHGGIVLPKFDSATATHIITETNEKNTLRALGLKNLSEIPLEIPTVYWSWVISGKPIPGEQDKQQMDYEFMHAAFPSRMDAGRSFTGKGKAKQKLEGTNRAAVTDAPQPVEIPCACLTFFTIGSYAHLFLRCRCRSPRAVPYHSSSSRESSCGVDEEELAALSDHQLPELRKGNATPVAGPSRRKSDSPPREMTPPVKNAPRKKQAGFICDDPAVTLAANSVPSINEDIVDKLSELAELHRARPTQDDKWRVIGYTKAIAALRRYGERITSVEQAMSLNGVGEKTALKIMEIIETGAYGGSTPRGRKTSRLFNFSKEYMELVCGPAASPIHLLYPPPGQSIAHTWYLAGCRTLEDIRQRKGGITLSQAQAIGLKYYDDINTRMPREEASEIFGAIKSIACGSTSEVTCSSPFPRSQVICGIMGSYRRGKSTCGDIDVMITRSPDDGRTHAGRSCHRGFPRLGILLKLLSALRSAGIVTEDLSLSSGAGENLECTYRGLCIRPTKVGEDKQHRIQRRIDILTIPWESRGAALIYYTGDDILCLVTPQFNRSIRLKANKMGYSLNQRGLFAGVVRSIEDRSVKTNAVLLPSRPETTPMSVNEGKHLRTRVGDLRHSPLGKKGAQRMALVSSGSDTIGSVVGGGGGGGGGRGERMCQTMGTHAPVHAQPWTDGTGALPCTWDSHGTKRKNRSQRVAVLRAPDVGTGDGNDGWERMTANLILRFDGAYRTLINYFWQGTSSLLKLKRERRNENVKLKNFHLDGEGEKKGSGVGGDAKGHY
ncbi:hypothetical protein BC826DRAFT_973144 [Russula brevipes]|nr:hypothetical protein BC826DRAFT_973144 [Russula brevipes]